MDKREDETESAFHAATVFFQPFLSFSGETSVLKRESVITSALKLSD
jgi:hypothetical protein